MEGTKKCISVYINESDLDILKKTRIELIKQNRLVSISELIRDAIYKVYINGNENIASENESQDNKIVDEQDEQEGEQDDKQEGEQLSIEDDKQEVNLWDINLDM